MDTVIAEIRLKRGKKADLPVQAPLGEPMWMEDTGELYVGQGEGKAPKLINENVTTLRQAIQTLENNKANKVHTHTVSEVSGLNDTLTALREEDVRLDTKIDQRIEEAIDEISSSSSSNTYKVEHAKSGFVDFTMQTDKSLYDYPPIKVYKKYRSWRSAYDYEKYFDDINEENLYLTGRVFNEKLSSSIVATKAMANPTQIVGGSYPNGNPYATLIEIGDSGYNYYGSNYEYAIYPGDYGGIYVYRDNNHSNISFSYDYIYDGDSNTVGYALSGEIGIYSEEIDFDNFYIDIIHSEDYFVPDNLVAIFSFGLYSLEGTMYEEKYAFLEPNSSGGFNIVLYDKPNVTSELMTKDFINRFGVKANTLDFIRNNYDTRVRTDKIVEALKELIQMEGFYYQTLLISFVTNNETVLPQEVAMEDWMNNLHNAYFTTKTFMTDFEHHPITSRKEEMEYSGSINYPDGVYKSGDNIPITFYNLINPSVIEGRDIRYKLDIDLPPGSHVFLNMFLGYDYKEFITYDWYAEKFSIVGEDDYYYEDEGDIPLELFNNLKPEQWNDLFDLILEYSNINQGSTALNVKLFIYTSKSYLERTNPIKINGLLAEQVNSEWYEEDKNPLTTTILYEDEETDEKMAEVKLGYSVHDNYKDYGAIEGTIIREDYMVHVPYEDYVKRDWSNMQRMVEVRTAQELIDELNDVWNGTHIDIKNDLDFQNINLSDSLEYIYGYNLTINGNGYALKNIRTNGKSLTSRLYYSTIKDLTIENLYADINNQNESNNFGILCGAMYYSTIENVVVKNSTLQTSEQNRTYIYGLGMLVGHSDGNKITNCHVYNSKITNLNTYASSGSSGGLIGTCTMTTIDKCSYVGGTMLVQNYVGGLVGESTSSKITNCYINTDFVHNDYDVLLNTSGYGNNIVSVLGGIVGYVTNHIHLENCYNYSTFNGGSPMNSRIVGDYGVGYLIGYLNDSHNTYVSRVKNCFYGGSGWYNYRTEVQKHYNEEAGLSIPEESYKYKNMKVIGNVGYADGDFDVMNVIYDNVSFFPLNRDQMGDTELFKFDFDNTWQISTEGFPILKSQANHYIPSTPIRDLKILMYPEKRIKVNNFDILEIELDVLDMSTIKGIGTPYIDNYYSGVFFTKRKLEDLKNTATETGEAIKTLSFYQQDFSARLAVDTPKISSLASISEFSGTWTRANVYSGRNYNGVSPIDYKSLLQKCMTELGLQVGDKMYMYITSGMPTDYTTTTSTGYIDETESSYRSSILKFSINQEEKIDYGKTDIKNVLLISSYDEFNFTNEEHELISTLTYNGKIYPTLRNPDLFALNQEEIEECFDLIIISKVDPEHYYEYGYNDMIERWLNHGIPVINTSSQLANYQYTPNVAYRIPQEVGKTIEMGTNIAGASEVYNVYNSQSYMTLLNTTHPLLSSLGVADNTQIQLIDTEIYTDTGIIFSAINQEFSAGQTLIKDENGNTLLAVIPKGTNGSNADYITYKILDTPYGVLTQVGMEITKSVINNALLTNSTNKNEVYVFEGDTEYYGEDYNYNEGYTNGNNNGSGSIS